jgi:hypothetical protein
VNTDADAFARLMDGGFIDIYDGAQPETADTPLEQGPQVRADLVLWDDRPDRGDRANAPEILRRSAAENLPQRVTESKPWD